MSEITFQCYVCSQSMKVAAANAGKKAKCFNCGTILTIPTQSVDGTAPGKHIQSQPTGQKPAGVSHSAVSPPFGGAVPPALPEAVQKQATYAETLDIDLTHDTAVLPAHAEYLPDATPSDERRGEERGRGRGDDHDDDRDRGRRRRDDDDEGVTDQPPRRGRRESDVDPDRPPPRDDRRRRRDDDDDDDRPRRRGREDDYDEDRRGRSRLDDDDDRPRRRGREDEDDEPPRRRRR
ncbi:MAG: hypothetical protein ACFCD0_10580 [Gemmataceae bacterium]